MRRRRLATFLGLSIASGVLLAACAGAPAPSLSGNPAGFVSLPFHLPALYAPAPVLPEVPVSAPVSVQTLPLKVPASAVDRARARMEDTIQASMGGCHH